MSGSHLLEQDIYTGYECPDCGVTEQWTCRCELAARRLDQDALPFGESA